MITIKFFCCIVVYLSLSVIRYFLKRMLSTGSQPLTLPASTNNSLETSTGKSTVNKYSKIEKKYVDTFDPVPLTIYL